MEAQEILENKENLIKFLKDCGLKEETDYFDDEYKEGVYFKVDRRKLLVIYEIIDEQKLKEIKDHFLIDRGLSYCTISFNHKLIFFRNFGETKHFIYSERTKNNISKIDKLKEIGVSIDGLFQTKDISAQFYEAFKLKRNLLVQHIKNNIEPTEKYLISQKIFDRFFFIYFLCHKGIIKFKDGGKVSGENLFSKILLKKGDFLENLKSLFHKFNFQGERNKRILNIGDYDIFIPYLNGGLFRPDVLEQNLNISLRNAQWEDIFEFLNSYHWIIEDVKATEEDEDKILTPEILGHVYERSVVEWEQKGFKEEAEEAVKKITERKKRGVYYTPESITDYISNNTIIPYLLDKLDNKYKSFDELVESKNKADYKKAISILNEIKVLDPACGSGAFLIKASEVIFGLKRRLSYLLKEKLNSYNLKLDIITENIYGADILAGAIEISKLRLWLWLIADFEESKNEIKALPNIEYNLIVGNSLIGWVDEKLLQISLTSPMTDEVRGIFKGLITNSIYEKKELQKAREFLEKNNLEGYIEAYYILYTIYKKAHGERATDLKEILQTIREAIYKSINNSFLHYINKKIKPNHDTRRPPIDLTDFVKLTPFHWRVDFGHIIKSGGFDVVIANPPYGDRLNRNEKLALSFYRISNCGDISANFIERQLDLLKRGGRIGNISILKLVYDGRFIPLRNSIRQNLEITRISCFERRPCQIFKDAQIQVGIFFGKKFNKVGNLGTIETSKFIRLTKEDIDNLGELLENIVYYPVEGFIMGDRIGGDVTTNELLPKIGNKQVANILTKLKSFHRIVKDVTTDDGKFIVYRRRGGGYHPTGMLEKIYKTSGLEPISFVNEVYRDFVFLLINSQLFYLYWMVYSNARNLDTGLIKRFPLPDESVVKKNSERIKNLSNSFWKAMKREFDEDTKYVNKNSLRSMIRDIDNLLGEIYSLDKTQIEFVDNYDECVWKNNSTGDDLIDE